MRRYREMKKVAIPLILCWRSPVSKERSTTLSKKKWKRCTTSTWNTKCKWFRMHNLQICPRYVCQRERYYQALWQWVITRQYSKSWGSKFRKLTMISEKPWTPLRILEKILHRYLAFKDTWTTQIGRWGQVSGPLRYWTGWVLLLENVSSDRPGRTSCRDQMVCLSGNSERQSMVQ